MFHPAYLHEFANRVTGHQVGRRFVPQRTTLFACAFCGEHLGTTADGIAMRERRETQRAPHGSKVTLATYLADIEGDRILDLTDGSFVRKSLAEIHPTVGDALEDATRAACRDLADSIDRQMEEDLGSEVLQRIKVAAILELAGIDPKLADIVNLDALRKALRDTETP